MSKKRDFVGQLTTRPFHLRGVPFSQRLAGHSSCVNALAWSGNGRWLASAGDGEQVLFGSDKTARPTRFGKDRRVCLWDFHHLDDVLPPPLVATGPQGNVLSLAFTATSASVLSGGLDEVVLQYDVSRMCVSSLDAEQPIRGRFSQHNGCIRAITPHPYVDEMFLTGSEDHTVILHDTRVPQSSRGVGNFTGRGEVTGVQYHPLLEHLFVMCDSKGNCGLWDTRTAFGEQQKTRPLVNYVTTVSKAGKSQLTKPQASSVVFDGTGTRLAVTMLHYYPIIYALWDDWPVAACSGADGAPTVAPRDSHETIPSPPDRPYLNGCTIKNGSFGSPGLGKECYFGTGSDNFMGYVWHVPDGLANYRREVKCADWIAECDGQSAGFAKSVTGQRFVPVELRQPHFLVYGHKSIVNTLLFHPFEPYLATSGIERHVIVHSPFGATPACGKLARTECRVRPLPEIPFPRARILRGFYDADDDNDDTVIGLFDAMLLSEEPPDVFDMWEFGADSDSESDRDLHSSSNSDSEAVNSQ